MKSSGLGKFVCAVSVSASMACYAQDHAATLDAAVDTELVSGGQFVRVTLSAWIDQDRYDLFASTNFDVIVHTREPVSWRALVSHGALMIYEPPATYRNVQLGQLHFPPIGAFGDETNPLPIFELEFFTTDVSLSELTIEVPLIFSFNVYEDSDSVEVTELDPGQFPDSLRWTLPIGIPCRADFDGDGALTIFDFLAYQNAFSAGDPIADFDGDGELTIFDFLAFQNEFDAGCE